MGDKKPRPWWHQPLAIAFGGWFAVVGLLSLGLPLKVGVAAILSGLVAFFCAGLCLSSSDPR